MPLFTVTQRETHTMSITIEAKDAETAEERGVDLMDDDPAAYTDTIAVDAVDVEPFSE